MRAVGGNYLERHWFGQMPLAWSYWINGKVVGIGLTSVLAVVGRLYSRRVLPTGGMLFPAVAFPIVATVLVWQWVGIWRAATSYAKTSTTPVWGHAARILVVGGAVFLTASIVRVGVPRIQDVLNAVRGDPQFGPTRIVVLAPGTAVEFDGPVRRGNARQLERALMAAPTAHVLFLDTPGGRVDEALRLAAVARRCGLSTYVEGTCASAGIFIFLAGQERVLKTGGRLGFHNFRSPGFSLDQLEESQAEILERDGVSASFESQVLSVPSSGIWFPTPEELREGGVITRVTNGGDYPLGFAARAAFSASRLRAYLLKRPPYAQINGAMPEAFAAAIRDVVGRIKQGDTVQRAYEPLQNLRERWQYHELLQGSGQ